MTLTQQWVGYLDRSYEQIKRSLLSRLSTSAPEVTDYSETNPLIIIISMFCGVAEVLNLYIDSAAREAFLPTARKFASAVKLVRLIDYAIKARSIATVNLLFTLTDTDGNPTTYTDAITIPENTAVTTANSGPIFLLLADLIIPAGISSAYAKAGQFQRVLNDILGNTNNTDNQAIALPDDYVHGTLEVTIDAQAYPLYNSFGLMGPTTKGCVVIIDEEGVASVTFGDGQNGVVPPTGKTIFANYNETDGVLGNIPPHTLTKLLSTLTLPTDISAIVDNPDYASGGADFEKLGDIQNLAPRSIRTLDRAVTYQDYIDVALQVPGVGAAEVKYCCGKFVDIFIAPNSKGTATQELVEEVQDYMESRVMITTRPTVHPSGSTIIWVKATVFGNPLYTAAQIQKELLDAWDLSFGPGVPKINRRVSITDLIAVAEGLKSVDTIQIEKVELIPYARPADETDNILNIEFTQRPVTSVRAKYTIIYNAAGPNFQIFKAGVFIQNLAIGVVFTDGSILAFRINAGVYDDNDKWEFTAFPSYPAIFPTTTIEINDYSAPIMDISPLISDALPRTINSDITYVPQGNVAASLPPC